MRFVIIFNEVLCMYICSNLDRLPMSGVTGRAVLRSKGQRPRSLGVEQELVRRLDSQTSRPVNVLGLLVFSTGWRRINRTI